MNRVDQRKERYGITAGQDSPQPRNDFKLNSDKSQNVDTINFLLLDVF